MSDATLLSLLDRIDRALLAEIEVLQEGRFQDLQALQAETQAAIRELDLVQAQPELPVLDKARINLAVVGIAQRAERARRLFEAALNGARSARNRVENLIRADGQIGAYDRSGAPVAMKSLASPYNKTL